MVVLYCAYLDAGDVFVIFIASNYFDSCVYNRASDKHKHCKNTASNIVLPTVLVLVMFTFPRVAHACLKRKERFKLNVNNTL